VVIVGHEGTRVDRGKGPVRLLRDGNNKGIDLPPFVVEIKTEGGIIN